MLPMVSIGLENYVATDKIALIVANVKASPTKRLIAEKKAASECYDMTGGRPMLSVVVLMNGHIILSSRKAKTIVAKLNGTNGNEQDDPAFDNEST